MYVFIMYIMCLIIFEEKAEVQDQYCLSLNPVQKANDPIQDRNRSIGMLSKTTLSLENIEYRLYYIAIE